jgi:hypothetical protein
VSGGDGGRVVRSSRCTDVGKGRAGVKVSPPFDCAQGAPSEVEGRRSAFGWAPTAVHDGFCGAGAVAPAGGKYPETEHREDFSSTAKPDSEAVAPLRAARLELGIRK